MTAEKRNFVDFTDFPGGINEDEGHYEFPRLEYADAHGKMRMWQIFICLVRGKKREKILDQYFYVKEHYCDLPDGVVAHVWSETGQIAGKITCSKPKIFADVANVGRSNQRNPFQQAMIYARKEFINKSARSGIDSGVAVRYFPMLAKTYKVAVKHLQFPVAVQRKYDGIRCIAYFSGSGAKSTAILYSRNKKDILGFDYLRDELVEQWRAFCEVADAKWQHDIYLDGELYSHGKSLQEISGIARNAARSVDAALQYYIYDCFWPREEKNTIAYRERADILRQFFAARARAEHLVMVPTFNNVAKEDVHGIFMNVVAEGYEGCILRNYGGLYKFSASKGGAAATRSNDLVKYKNKMSREYPIVNFTEGQGKDAECVIWTCKTPAGLEFRVTPNETAQRRHEIFLECQRDFAKKYKGKSLTVEFESLSEDGIPQRAKAIAIRDYE